jgi:hypothetical protein
MDTIRVYWLAFKYWLGGIDWEQAHETALKITFWDGGKSNGKKHD